MVSAQWGHLFFACWSLRMKTTMNTSIERPKKAATIKPPIMK